MTDEQSVTEGGAKVDVTVWTTSQGGPHWRVRLTEENDEGSSDLVVDRAVRGFHGVREEPPATPRPFGRRSRGLQGRGSHFRHPNESPRRTKSARWCRRTVSR